MSAPEPVTFGQYAVTRILGRSALGRVYHAEDPLHSRQVAVRVIRARVGRQLKAVPRLVHPGIIAVYDVGEAGRYSFVAMEFAAGGSLEEQIESGVELSPTQVVDLATQVAEALDYAHGQGVIHQDVRPANIMVAGDGRYKLADFRIDDIAEAIESGEEGADPEPFFLSPEQVHGLPLTPSTDQFSLAAVVYQLLTGTRPFGADTSAAVRLQISDLEPPSPSTVNPEVSAELSAVVMRGLSKEPHERYASCRAFAEAVQGTLKMATDSPPAETAAAPSGPGSTWDDTVLDSSTETSSADAVTPTVGSVLPERPGERRGSRFAVVVGAVVVLVVAAWLVWTLGLLGPARIETTLAVDSNPPDQSLAIWLDDVPTGLMTPAAVPLEGEEGQTVQLGLVRDDEVVASTSVALAAEMSAEWIPDVEVPLRPVRYEVRSEPTGARVRLDGQDIARPTPVEIDLFPGQSYDLEVELDGYEPSQRTLDPADLDPDVAALDFPLTRIVRPGRLRAEAAFPVTIVARAEGGDQSRVAGRSPSLELPPGRDRVTVTAPDVFFQAEADVTIREAEDMLLPDIPTAVKVLVFDVPGNATVRIDDFAAFPSGGPRTVVVGPHRFVFEWPTGERLEREIEIERDGQEVSARHP